jgi:hypothetical protein
MQKTNVKDNWQDHYITKRFWWRLRNVQADYLYCPSTLLSYLVTVEVTNTKLWMCQALGDDVIGGDISRNCIAICVTNFNTAKFNDGKNKQVQYV